jgi:glycerophosphoryl diester phosphodiesterase
MKKLMQPLLTSPLECWVIGHRGAAASCPENTLLSFGAARDAGAGMIEFDVQQSSDGELFVFHDHTLDRLCGESHVAASLSWEVLARKVIGHGQGRQLHMPHLNEVFATFRRSLFYNVELKANEVPIPGVEEKLVAAIAKHGLAERVLVSSFYHQSLRVLRQWSADLALGLLLNQKQAQQFSHPMDILTYVQEYDCFALHPDFRLLRQWPELVTACHAANVRVFPWTVDDPDDWQFLVGELHIDGIITNDPGKLYEWLLARARDSSARHL